ncbi:MAG: acyltransferase [Nitrososphaeria archaeon]|nr:acyltransferase [Nitrososphaeria archaeon]
MRRTLAVGIAQFRVGESVPENVKAAIDAVREASASGADILCLPELFAYRYFPQRRDTPMTVIKDHARLFGSIVEELRSACKTYQICLVAGSLVEEEGGKYYNTSVVIDENGNVVGRYRKTHIPRDECYYEDLYFTPGDSELRPFQVRGAGIGVLICFDQWFPEPARAYALNGADVVFYPTAIGWVSGVTQTEGDWKEAWEVVQRGHAVANSVAVVAANRTGVEGRIEFWGSSFIADQFGSVIAKMGVEEEGVLVRRVDLELGARIREGWGFFSCRRPELYARVIA